MNIIIKMPKEIEPGMYLSEEAIKQIAETAPETLLRVGFCGDPIGKFVDVKLEPGFIIYEFELTEEGEKVIKKAKIKEFSFICNKD